jgi:hypothetical protein
LFGFTWDWNGEWKEKFHNWAGITVMDLEFYTQRSLTRPSVIDEQGMSLETPPEEDA